MKALVVGATGAVGAQVVKQLVAREDIREVHVFVRRPKTYISPKVAVHVVDFDEPREWGHLLQGDLLISAMGTSRGQAGSKEKQWEVDYTYQYEAARMAAQNGVKKYGLVSSVGANSSSPFFYLSMKGKLDEAVCALPFESVVIIKPATLIRDEPRLVEKASHTILGAINTLGVLKSQKPVSTETVARVLVNATVEQQYGISIIENITIHERSEYFIV